MPRWAQAPSQVFSDCLATETSNLCLSTDWKRAEGSLSSSFCQERSSNSQVGTKSQPKQKPENVFLVCDFMRMPCTLFASRNAALQKSLFMTPYPGKSVTQGMKNKTPHWSSLSQHPHNFTVPSVHVGDNDLSELEGYGPEEEEGGPPLRPLIAEELSRTEPYTDLEKRLVSVTRDTWTCFWSSGEMRLVFRRERGGNNPPLCLYRTSSIIL